MCKHYLHDLEENDRHYVDAAHQNNCVLCLSEAEGPMTQAQVGKYLKICKMRVSQIERKARMRVKKKMMKLPDFS